MQLSLPQTLAKLEDNLGTNDVSELLSEEQLIHCVRTALHEISQVCPLEYEAVLDTNKSSYELDISALGDDCQPFELIYPYQPDTAICDRQSVPWDDYGDKLIMVIDRLPAAGEQALLRYSHWHTIQGLDDATTGTLDTMLETAVQLGAQVHALRLAISCAVGHVSPYQPLNSFVAAHREALACYDSWMEYLKRRQAMPRSSVVQWTERI